MDIMLQRIVELIGKRHGAKKLLADYLGISQNVFTSWFSGSSKSYSKYAPKIAEYYGVSLDYLVGNTDSKDRHDNLPENKIKPATVSSDGQSDNDSEIYSIVSQLTPDNRQKLLELGRLYLTSQQRNEEKQ